jgi:hypothetical protein
MELLLNESEIGNEKSMIKVSDDYLQTINELHAMQKSKDIKILANMKGIDHRKWKNETTTISTRSSSIFVSQNQSPSMSAFVNASRI